MRGTALAASLLSVALLASACGDARDTPEDEAAPEAETSWPEREASHGAVLPRLVVSDADSGTATVIDVATGETVGTVEGAGPARLTPVTADGTLVLLAQEGDDTVQLLDAGIRYEAHGGHADPKPVEPALVDGAQTIAAPGGVVVHDGHAAVLSHGDGAVSVFALDGSEAPAEFAAEATVETGADGAGSAVPVGHDLVVGLGDDNGVRVLAEDGAVEHEFADCPDAAGAAATAEATALFGCADGVLEVTGHDGEWEAVKIASPAGADGGRVTSIAGAPDQEVVLGDYSDESVVLIDTHDDTATEVAVPGTVAAIAWDPYWIRGLVLTADGVLHSVDPETGEIAHSVEATGGFAPEDGRAAIAVGENHVYLTNPATGELVEVSVSGDGLAVERNQLLDLSPHDLAVVGLAALDSGHEDEEAGHDHEDEEGHADHEGEEDGHGHEEDGHDH
ncbi:hypothetical protein [Actinorugispora endophytica]|uniref:Pyrroloquinoline-quinone binding quinoprotein n=1 Tax=Actinorugispora endophytica TaxID=1605990 RepID=A0A4R6V1S1_9ACTN|nr:hypothetical protein [Actinorugispora endophytica]TDQ51975.1 hypothetical protein EV190_10987 [Actinorugispora endophytica]